MAENKNTPPKHDTLADALAAFQGEMPSVHKGKTARIPGKSGGSGFAYSYADVADVTAAVMPLLAKHGLAFTCLPRQTEGGYEIAAQLMHGSSGQSVEGALPLFGRTSQEIGSAITYSRRYLLGCLTGVVTDDDEDGAAATAGARQAAPGQARTRQQAPQMWSDDVVVDNARAATTVDQVRDLWDAQQVSRRPQEIQDIVNQRGIELREAANQAVAGATGTA